ncbi:MAG: pilus assembly protein N-terminal domain-containing protein [Parvibaculaceae bacterium]|nr:pilus assembly protein N-terminal domain-containing protein [Parvibaculaceae bacterium]
MAFRMKNVALLSLSIGVAVATTMSAAQAAALSVTYNQSRLVSLSEPVSTFSVGNPSIIDATLISPTKVMILGKTYGVTDFIAMDADGKVILNTSLHVVANHSNRVSLYKGVSKRTLNCVGNCVKVIDLGDDAEVVDPLTKSTKEVHDLANKAANPDK